MISIKIKTSKVYVIRMLNGKFFKSMVSIKDLRLTFLHGSVIESSYFHYDASYCYLFNSFNVHKALKMFRDNGMKVTFQEINPFTKELQ